MARVPNPIHPPKPQKHRCRECNRVVRLYVRRDGWYHEEHENKAGDDCRNSDRKVS